MPKERLLPYVILGIVKYNAPITGQAITKQFDTEIGEFWRASHSQVYPELKRMCEDGWLVQRVSQENAKEKYYELTDEGNRILDRWLKAPICGQSNHRDLFSLKMFFIRDRNDGRIRSLMNEERTMLREQLAHLELRKKSVFADTAKTDSDYGHYLILCRAIARVTSQLEWIERTLREL